MGDQPELLIMRNERQRMTEELSAQRMAIRKLLGMFTDESAVKFCMENNLPLGLYVRSLSEAWWDIGKDSIERSEIVFSRYFNGEYTIVQAAAILGWEVETYDLNYHGWLENE